MRRALTLGLVLLKQCRTNVADKNLMDICIKMIQPSLSRDDDEEIQILAIESIGLLGLLDRGLFINYSIISKAILEEALQCIEQDHRIPKNQLHESILSLKSTFDGLIVHGIEPDTQSLLDIILTSLFYTPNRLLRQMTIEGMVKLLFSIRVTKQVVMEPENPAALEQTSKEALSQKTLLILLSHLIIQWFDTKYFKHQNENEKGFKKGCSSIAKKALDVFFRNYILFSKFRCQVVFQALLRVIYAILAVKYGVGPNRSNNDHRGGYKMAIKNKFGKIKSQFEQSDSDNS